MAAHGEIWSEDVVARPESVKAARARFTHNERPAAANLYLIGALGQAAREARRAAIADDPSANAPERAASQPAAVARRLLHGLGTRLSLGCGRRADRPSSEPSGSTRIAHALGRDLCLQPVYVAASPGRAGARELFDTVISGRSAYTPRSRKACASASANQVWHAALPCPGVDSACGSVERRTPPVRLKGRAVLPVAECRKLPRRFRLAISPMNAKFRPTR